MKRLKLGVLLAGAALTLPLFAEQLTCPDGLKYVNTGISRQAFIEACGQPKQVVRNTDKNSAAGYYVWHYRTFVPESNGSTAFGPQRVASPTMVAVVVHNDTIGAIRYLNQQGLTDTFHCGNHRSISVGQTTAELLQQCGPPVSREQLDHIPGQENAKMPEAILLEYQPQPYLPLTGYVFIDDKLVGKKTLQSSNDTNQ